MMTLTIDGKKVEVPEGTKVIEAAQKAGITIPRFCYHPALSIAGVCRLCTVAIEGQKKGAISCNTPVAEGMVVYTNTPEIQETRKGIYELHMANHPIDCPVCDQSGECVLQNYYMQVGRYKSAFKNTAEKVQKRKVVHLGEKIVLDTERCILCDRCVRFCNEITKNYELNRFNRGNHTEIGTFENRPLTGNYQENLVDVCPVGALLSKDFRFKVRVWWVEPVDSICNQCSRGCNIQLHVRKKGGQVQNTVFHPTNEVYRIKPRLHADVNSYWICDVGRYSYKQIHTESRLSQPLKKGPRGLQAKGWADAFEDIASRMRGIAQKSGPSSVAALGSAQHTNEENYLLWRWMKKMGTSPTVYHRAVPKGGRPGFHGDVDWGEFEDNLLIQKDKNPNTRGVQAVGFHKEFTLDGAGLLPAIERGEIKALYCLGDPLRDLQNKETFLSALSAMERLELLVVQDAYPSDLASRATWVLPGVTFAEKEGTFTNFQGRVQRIRKAIEPLGEAKADWEILSEFVKRFEGGEFSSAEGIFEALAQEIPAFHGMTYEMIGSKGVMLPLTQTLSPQSGERAKGEGFNP